MKVILMLLLFSSLNLFATGQIPDYLIMGQDTLKIHSNPLEKYFEKNPIPEKLITMRSSGNWRGYIAYFKFVDNQLVVENIYKEEYKISENGKHDFFLTSIYKEIFGSSAYFNCSFYSGLLICPYGKLVEYVHMGYSSLYENYKIFEVGSGKIIKSQNFTGEEFQNFKIDYFKYFKTTEEYRLKVAEFKKMMIETDSAVEDAVKSIDDEINEKPKKKKKENKYLKQKEAEFKADKETDSFLFLFLSDYMKTLEIPKKQ